MGCKPVWGNFRRSISSPGGKIASIPIPEVNNLHNVSRVFASRPSIVSCWKKRWTFRSVCWRRQPQAIKNHLGIGGNLLRKAAAVTSFLQSGPRLSSQSSCNLCFNFFFNLFLCCASSSADYQSEEQTPRGVTTKTGSKFGIRASSWRGGVRAKGAPPSAEIGMASAA